MKTSHFFSMVSRLKLIVRWPLMRNTQSENVAEHSLQVAFVAHMLAMIKNRHYGGTLNPDHIAVLAMYHDASEVLTGDLPTPTKYSNPQLTNEYKKIEKLAQHRLIAMLPDEFIQDFTAILDEDEFSEEERFIVKSADTLCAYLKTLEESAVGNREFIMAQQRIEKKLEEIKTPEVIYFMEHFIPSFKLGLDEMSL